MIAKLREDIVKNWLIKGVITILILTFVFLICVMDIPLTNKRRHIDFDAIPYPIELQSGDTLVQQFHVKYPDLYTIGFCVLDQSHLQNGTVNMEIVSPEDIVLFSKKASIVSVPNGDFYRTEVNITLEKGIEYELRITLTDANGKLLLGAIDDEANISEFHGAYWINEVEEDGISLALFIRYHLSATVQQKICASILGIVMLALVWLWNWICEDKRYRNITICSCFFAANILIWKWLLWKGNEDFFKTFQNWIISLLIVGFCILMYLLYIKEEDRVERYFVLYSIVFGILYCAVWIPFSGFDERAHFNTAYAMSSQVLGQPAVTGDGHYVLFEEQHAIDIMEMLDATKDYTINYYGKLRTTCQEKKNIIYIEHQSFTALSTYTIMELPQAFGVTLGRILGLNLFGLITCGRIANFLTFVILFYISIKIIPFGKCVLFAISQFPSVSIIKSSLSYDVTVLGLICIYVSYILYLVYKKKKYRLWNFVLVGILAIIIGPLKWVYFPMIFMLLVIEYRNMNIKKWVYYSIFIIVLIVSIQVCVDTIHGKYLNTCNLKENSTIDYKLYYEDSIYEESQQKESNEEYHFVESPEFYSYTVPYMINNPQYTLETIIKSIYSDLDTYVFSIFGGQLDDEHGYGLSMTLLALELVMFIFVLCFDEAIQIEISNRQCVIALGTFLCAFLMVFFSFLWGGGAVADYKFIFGIQGRYFIPAMLPLLLVFKRRASSYLDIKNKVLLGYAFLQMYAILNSCNVVWGR